MKSRKWTVISLPVALTALIALSLMELSLRAAGTRDVEFMGHIGGVTGQTV